MLPSNLPTSLTQWRRYFDVTFKLIEEVVPTISLGYNKIDLILTNLQAFRTSFLTDHQPTVTPKESWILFEFFKTCAAFISYSSQYNSKKILHYIISHPINGQYNELAELFNSWSVLSSMLLCDSFRDITLLGYAHYLDLIAIRDSFGPIATTFPKQISCALKKKLDDISKLLTFVSQKPKNQNIRIFDNSQIIKGDKINENKFSFPQYFKAHIKPSTDEITIIEFQESVLSTRQIIDFKYNLNAYLSFNHPNVLSLKGATSTPPYNIILNNLIKGNLSDVLHKENQNNNNILSPSQKLKISLGIIRGLEYFDAMRFVHKDLNPENILLDNEYNAFISYFAINTKPETENCSWTSPEILVENEQQNSSSVDIYSFGMILWELLTCKKPFEDLSKNQLQIAEMIINQNKRPNIPSNASKEISELIQSCWAANPKDRPKASTIRNILEGKSKEGNNNINYIKFYLEEDISEFIKWSNETKSAHENIINKVNEANKAKEEDMINQLNQITQLDIPKTIYALKELHHFDKKHIPNLIDILLKLINQNRSYSIQEESFILIKKILNSDDITSFIDPNKFIDQILPIVGSQPNYILQLVRIIAPKIENTDSLIDKFISMSKTYFTTEVIKIIISEKSSKINPRKIIKLFESIPDQLSIEFLRFILSVYGPIETFFPSSCKSTEHISVFFYKLSTFCEDFRNIQKVKDMINIEIISTLSESSLKRVLYSISRIVLIDYKTNQNDFLNMTIEMASILFYFVSQYCIKFNHPKTALIILNMCLFVPSMRTVMSQTALEIWDLLTDSIKLSQKIPSSEKVHGSEKVDNNDQLLSALHIIEEIPICPDSYRRQKLWVSIVDRFKATRDLNVAQTICSILSRKSDTDLQLLFPTFNDAISGDDDQFCLTVLKILRNAHVSILTQFLNAQQSSRFWPSLTKQMRKQVPEICESIGRLVFKMVQEMPDFQLDAPFLRSVIELIYNKMTSLDTSLPFIFFLGDAIRAREVVLYLQRESFVQYLQQLVWRYENDPRVPDVVDYFTTSLKQHYSQM